MLSAFCSSRNFWFAFHLQLKMCNIFYNKIKIKQVLTTKRFGLFVTEDGRVTILVDLGSMTFEIKYNIKLLTFKLLGSTNMMRWLVKTGFQCRDECSFILCHSFLEAFRIQRPAFWPINSSQYFFNWPIRGQLAWGGTIWLDSAQVRISWTNQNTAVQWELGIGEDLTFQGPGVSSRRSFVIQRNDSF